ncbi:MAG TPA: hypothetical protein VFG48_00525 [Xanthomonadales bacterium]|nr:hypothetical protein [Xanthomonadales bacterium]
MIRITSCFLFALLCATAARAEAPLFADDTVMKITIPLDFKELCRPRESENCDFTPTTLIYTDQSGDKRSVPIEIKVRGGWRSLSRNCSTPLLWVRFDESGVAGTPFEGQSLLPLTTHCGKGVSIEALTQATPRADFEQYLLREFLAHRIYNALTDLSLRARLVRISYPDPDRFGKSMLHYAFFSEHFDAAAARTGSQRPQRGHFSADRLDPQTAARLALFQYMIGNTDWSIARERNTVLLEDPEGRQFPVPYDLDMSGLVDADYAGPAPGLPIEHVRERLFLGFCQPGVDWDALFAEFHGRMKQILKLDDRLPGLSRGSKRWVHRYLEGFFSILASEEQRSETITGACQPWPPSPVDHTAPLDN